MKASRLVLISNGMERRSAFNNMVIPGPSPASSAMEPDCEGRDAGANIGEADGPGGRDAGSVESIQLFASIDWKLDGLAPSMALAVPAACGVRVGNPANAVGFCPQTARAAPE